MDKFTERALQFNLSRLTAETELGQFLPDKSKHNRKNWLRHVRLTHLRQCYDFNEFDLCNFRMDTWVRNGRKRSKWNA